MNDAKKTRKQLVEELAEARARIAELEASEVEHERAKEGLVEEHSLLRTIIDNLPDYIYVKDTESRYLVSNTAHARFLGAAASGEIAGRTVFELYPQELAARYYADDQEVIQSGQPLLNREERSVDQAGNSVWNLTSKVPLRDSDGKIVGLVGIARDVTALKRAELALERRALQLQTAAEVSHVASTILDPRELIQQVVDLVSERFDLYYVGLFLVDQTSGFDHRPGEWTDLQAGTGEAGREMRKQRHRLKVGGNSMVGQCIASGEARIALDVGEEAVRLSNPLLPETRSELALPLISRRETIGALTIQSSQEAAFSEEDIAVFQMMANHLANAIETARLFTQLEEELEELKVNLRLHIREAWSRYLDRDK